MDHVLMVIRYSSETQASSLSVERAAPVEWTDDARSLYDVRVKFVNDILPKSGIIDADLSRPGSVALWRRNEADVFERDNKLDILRLLRASRQRAEDDKWFSDDVVITFVIPDKPDANALASNLASIQIYERHLQRAQYGGSSHASMPGSYAPESPSSTYDGRSTEEARTDNANRLTLIDIEPARHQRSPDVTTLVAALHNIASDSKEVDHVQPKVHSILQALTEAGYLVVHVKNNRGIRQNIDARYVLPDAADNSKHNPDHLVFKVSGGKLHLVLFVESKVVTTKADKSGKFMFRKTLQDPNEIHKFLDDLSFLATVFDLETLPGVMLDQNEAVFYQLLKDGRRSKVVLRFKPTIKVADDQALAKTLFYGISHASFLGGAHLADHQRLVKVLGFGATSVVFQTASTTWPVAKVLTGPTDRAWELATREIVNVDTVFRSANVTETGCFLDATLDASRQPRSLADPNTAPVTVTQAGTAPVVYYSRLCKPIPPGYFSPGEKYGERKKQLIDACWQLHQGGIVHNDLRTDNIMIDPRTDRLVLGDFGFSHVIDHKSRWDGGTVATASPHLLLLVNQTPQVDTTFLAVHDLWSVASLCLHDADADARAVAFAAARRFRNDRYEASGAISDMWAAKEQEAKWAAVMKLLTEALATVPVRSTYEMLCKAL